MHSIGKLFLTVLLVLLLFTGCSTADAYPPSATDSENLAKFSLGLVIDPEETLNFQQWMIEAVQNAGLPVNVKGFTQKQIASITADCAANTPDNLRECVQLQTQTDVLAVLYSLPNDDGSMTVLAEIITPNYDWLYQQVWPAGTQDKSTFANSTVYFSTLQHSLSSPDNDVMAWLKENRAKVFLMMPAMLKLVPFYLKPICLTGYVESRTPVFRAFLIIFWYCGWMSVRLSLSGGMF